MTAPHEPDDAVAALGGLHPAAERRAARARRQRARADAEQALQNARDVYARRGEAVSIWVVPSAAITASTPGGRGSVLRSRQRQAVPAPAVLQGAARRAGLLSERTATPERAPLFEYLLRLGDDRLVLGHRLSEWCGHGPILEEDIALANIALDLIGQATLLLKLAGEVEGQGRDEDALAYFRDAHRVPQRADSSSCRTATSASRSCGSSSSAPVRVLLLEALAAQHRTPSSPASRPRPCKETRYHVRHSARVGAHAGRRHRGESRRVAGARSTSCGATPANCSRPTTSIASSRAPGIGVDPSSARARVARAGRATCFARATLTVPADGYMQRGGREGRHTEHLGHMLAEMQIVARSHPGAKW